MLDQINLFIDAKGMKDMDTERHVRYTVAPDAHAKFVNHTGKCIGTGRMGLALRKEYLDQLAFTQEKIGFSHIRGHGLFSDDMGIYQPYTDAEGVRHERYCFTYLDQVMDSYLHLGLKPFLELGFMPHAMAGGTQTLFYWRANVTPPADMGKWTAMVKATLRHLAERYGEREVSEWPCEVWNEPNLTNFWENRDKAKYFALYQATAIAVKETLPNMKVGGPAICGGSDSLDWVRDFLTFCRDEKLPLDFVTRHAYMGQTPEHKGRYMYHSMCAVEDLLGEMERTRAVIDSFPEYRGMPMHITEFNTSYNPFCPIHDTNLNAAYLAGLLSRFGDVADSYSYWTFGDVFEESGVPSLPFHGGFGLVANGSIAKPAFWTFAFFRALSGEAVLKNENIVLLKKENGGYEGVAWNLCREKREHMRMTLELPFKGQATLMTRTVDEQCCDPLKCWHEMGEPASLSEKQLAFLRTAAQPKCETAVLHADADRLTLALSLSENAVIHFELTPYKKQGDYGYDYEWYREHT